MRADHVIDGGFTAMKMKKKVPESKKIGQARPMPRPNALTKNTRTKARTIKAAIKNIKTRFASKPLFDPIAGP